MNADSTPMTTEMVNTDHMREPTISAAAGGMTVKANTGSAPIARVETEMAMAKVTKSKSDQKLVRRPSVRAISASKATNTNSLPKRPCTSATTIAAADMM